MATISRRRRSFVWLAVVAVLMLFTAACGDGDSDDDGTVASATEPAAASDDATEAASVPEPEATDETEVTEAMPSDAGTASATRLISPSPRSTIPKSAAAPRSADQRKSGSGSVNSCSQPDSVWTPYSESGCQVPSSHVR